MRKAFSLVLTLAMMLALCSCRPEKVRQDESPVTMLVTYGNGEAYFRHLAEKVKSKYGIEVSFVYEISTNPTDQLKYDFANDSLPADIVFTGMRVPDKYLKTSCVDLLANSRIPAHFPYGKLKECSSDNGSVYQLPVCSRLIGITYNETLMQEMGWKRPENFRDMLELKAKCDNAGIPFAVTDIRETGHGFNYLFHIMGAQWLSSMRGTGWFMDFMNGRESVNAFQRESAYFRKWVENGLFCSANFNWGGNYEFARRRALFSFALLNTTSGYDGPQVDANGRETGRTLHDVHRTMPWISENGDNNCFTIYDSSWVAVNRRLLEECESEKLAKVFQILEYMTSGEFAEYTSSLGKDIFLPFSNYTITPDRLYFNYAKEIGSGFVQPWYYERFKTDTVFSAGSEINSYMLKTMLDADQVKAISGKCNYPFNFSADYNSIFTVLARCMQASDAEASIGRVDEKLQRKDTARLCAISSAFSLQKALAEDGNAATVQVAMMPYAERLEDMQPWRNIPVENSVLYPGMLEKSTPFVIIPGGYGEVCGIRMTGREIREIVEKGFDPSSRTANFDSQHYGPYPYVCPTKGDMALMDDVEYVVAVAAAALEKPVFSRFSEVGKVIARKDGDKPLTANTASGIALYMAEHPRITTQNIDWR